MKVETSTVTKLLITGAPALDPITVFLEELPIYRGKMIVECYGRSWSAYWGNMGGTLTQFLKSVSTDYVANCMFQGSTQEYDSAGMEAMLRKEVIQRRRKGYINAGVAQNLWMQIDHMDFGHPFHLDNDMMVKLIGEDWHVCLPQRTNPDFAYLTRIIDAAREAIAKIYTPEIPND